MNQTDSTPHAGIFKTPEDELANSIDSLNFYTKRGETIRKHAGRLREMYSARAKKDTPTSDAIWAGFAALQEQAEKNEVSRLIWVDYVEADRAKVAA